MSHMTSSTTELLALKISKSSALWKSILGVKMDSLFVREFGTGGRMREGENACRKVLALKTNTNKHN